MTGAGSKAKKILQFIKNADVRYQATIAMAAEFVALQLMPTTYQPDAVIAGLPVYHTQHEGHAASDEMLKYRSMGTLFLAHQKGGKRTFKCTLLIQGPARLYVLMFLQFLQKNGMEQNITLSTFASDLGIDLFGTDVAMYDPFIPPSTNDKITYMQGYHIEAEMIEWHRTFPIITDTKIYTNMYLETLRYVEDVKIGVDTMEIDLAFREFIPPQHVMWHIANEETAEKGYFVTWLTNEERDALRRIDLSINAIWSLRPLFADYFSPTIQQKQLGQYVIEASVLVVGALLARTSIWGK